METCSRSHLLWFVYITFPVLGAQEIQVLSEVTGYLGFDVTMPCQFIQGPSSSITQVEWDLKPAEGEKINIIVSNVRLGVLVTETSLKGRVEFAEQSLIIRDVKIEDAGLYSCRIAAFPIGLFEGTTNLVVQEPIQITQRMIATGIFMLIVLIMAATTYVIIIRIRREALDRHRVCTGGPVMEAICD